MRGIQNIKKNNKKAYKEVAISTKMKVCPFPKTYFSNSEKTHKRSQMQRKSEGVSNSPNKCCLGNIFLNVFSPKAAGPEAPSFWEKNEDHFGGPRTILKMFGDEVTYPKFQKIMTSSLLAISHDQIRRTRGPKSCVWCFRTFWAYQNSPKPNIGQNNFVGLGPKTFPGALGGALGTQREKPKGRGLKELDIH